jgi:hypothetical protein
MNLNLDDGTVIPLVEYIEVRTVVPGQSVVIFDAYGNSAYASLARPAQDALLNGLVIPEPTIQLEKGEQGPVFMAGPWRVAIVAAAQNNRLRGIGLEKKDGKEWVAVVADVTNWGSSNPAFPVEEFFMEMVESPTQHSVASGSTATAARELGLSTDSPVEIEYGKTGRVVMVFSVNADRSEPTLVYRLERLPLDDILLFDLEQSDLSAPAGPPDLQQARLDSVSEDGQYIEVRYEGESKTHRLQLLGVDVSGTPDAAIALLTEFDGEFVWIETDPAIKSTGTPSVYLWFENDRGDLQMLNHLLLQEGAAKYDELPGDARFATWLASTAARVTAAE